MIERFVLWLDDRLGTAHFIKHALRKAFPDHWSFMLGEINLYCFFVLLATGTFLAFNFDPSPAKLVYQGPYRLLDGMTMSTAYASALHLSFAVNAGLLIRQIHHWAALVFVAGIVTHMSRVFFTGAFRNPRELNWLIGVLLFILAMAEGFTGYSLPDDLLSGIGLRIADSVLLSIPVVGTWGSFLLLGGAFPGPQMGPRLFAAHVFLLPAIIAGTIAVHLAILWRQKHTQFPGPGHTETNVVGSRLFPNYAVKSAALGCGTVAILAALGAFVQINPIWLYGPYVPYLAASPAQPDWYVGWLDGALRVSWPWSIHVFGHLIPSPFFPGLLLPGVLFIILFGWPFIERVITKDRAPHHLLDRPHDVPWRTGVGIALFVLALGLTLAGSDDVQARYLHLPIDVLTIVYRWFCIVAPIVAFFVARAVSKNLRATGGVQKTPRVRLRRNEQGGFDEEPIP
ncbi:MAG: cytochrome bc complex cytochrome b subunit [Candidatus Tumulicola sp.]